MTTLRDLQSVGLAPAVPRRLVARPGRGDRVFRHAVRAASLLVLVIMGAVGILLAVRGSHALRVAGFHFLTTQAWQPDAGHFGIAAVLLGTVLIAAVAIAVATPISLGTALFLAEVAPPRLARVLVALVDLMAAIPSIVFGLWGLLFLQGHLIGVSRWISTWFGWIPLFNVPSAGLGTPTVYTAGTFIAGVVVGLMIMPIQCSIMREVFSRAPLGEREGAYALGATRWTMIRRVVIPFGRGGIIGGTMLALGRALGETISVVTILSISSQSFQISNLIHILQSGGISVSSLIATYYDESTGFGISALMAAGLALFVLTLAINFGAATIVARSRSGAHGDA
jgi:phosphate transport system permease protein